ncbi:MAG: hypothetical protein PHU25_02300 [Deltaproteobacteria bacterium]|nr:hypothetical protein [Deltaproteobacteria bacterium]
MVKKKKSVVKPRNAYAVPARQRKNAGPMIHKDPPREKPQGPAACAACGAPLDEGDPGPLCAACEAEKE